MVVHAGVGEQRRVQAVVGMVVAQHHVGHLLGRHPQLLQRVQDQRAVPDHARVGHHPPVPVGDEADRGGHTGAGIAGVQHRMGCGHGGWSIVHGHPSGSGRGDDQSGPWQHGATQATISCQPNPAWSAAAETRSGALEYIGTTDLRKNGRPWVARG
jgi:hypothetical protein